MYGKARQLPKFNFKRGELLTVINGSYGEREKWVGKFSLQHSTEREKSLISVSLTKLDSLPFVTDNNGQDV